MYNTLQTQSLNGAVKGQFLYLGYGIPGNLGSFEMDFACLTGTGEPSMGMVYG